jgi:hypothetical protein
LTDIVRPEEVLATSGSWVLTTYEDYLIAFDRRRHQLLKKVHGANYTTFAEMKENLKRVDPYIQSPMMSFAKDELEVFIEKI